jgi:hypothetical protein
VRTRRESPFPEAILHLAGIFMQQPDCLLVSITSHDDPDMLRPRNHTFLLKDGELAGGYDSKGCVINRPGSACSEM